MKLPNAENAIITADKVAEYLLDLGHRRGAGKAKILYSLGYTAQYWQELDLGSDRPRLITMYRE